MRGRVDLVGHSHYRLRDLDPAKLPVIQNVIVKARAPDQQWVEEATRSIGDWRAVFRSTYIRWALAINGLFVASEAYRNRNEPERRFTVSSLRARPTGEAEVKTIADWDFAFAAEAYRDSAPMLCAWGLMDLYAVLEEFVFGMYRIFLSHHPNELIRGPEFSTMRRLYRQRDDSLESRAAWEAAWQQRLASWQRKRLYDGLGRVFLALCQTAGIKAPSTYRHTTPETWAEVIDGIAIVRNCLTHGATTVSAELEAFCRKPYSIGFSFTLGSPLQIELMHLQGVECFTDQLLTALNLSLCEIAGLRLPASEVDRAGA